MGTTLHAILEVYHSPIELSSGQMMQGAWWDLAEFDFGKDYATGYWLSRNASRGWPPDSRCLHATKHEYHDGQRQWCSLQALRDARAALWAAVLSDGDPPHSSLDALIAAADVYVERFGRFARAQSPVRSIIGEVRVLWYRL